MQLFKKIINKILGKEGLHQQVYPTQKEKSNDASILTQKEETILIDKKEEERVRALEKSDEELIAELNTIAPGIFSQAKTPEMKKMIINIYKKMLEDGVDVRNEKEVEKWIAKNQDLLGAPTHKVETYKREKPKIGRNDPCPCGSGKKYKKCCGTNE